MYLNRKSDTVDTYGIRVQYVKPAYVATAMLQSTNPNIHVIPNDGDDSDEEYDVENYGDSSWWDVKRRMIVNRFESTYTYNKHRYALFKLSWCLYVLSLLTNYLVWYYVVFFLCQIYQLYRVITLYKDIKQYCISYLLLFVLVTHDLLDS